MFAKYHQNWMYRSKVTRLQNDHIHGEFRGVTTFISKSVYVEGMCEMLTAGGTRNFKSTRVDISFNHRPYTQTQQTRYHGNTCFSQNMINGLSAMREKQ